MIHFGTTTLTPAQFAELEAASYDDIANEVDAHKALKAATGAVAAVKINVIDGCQNWFAYNAAQIV